MQAALILVRFVHFAAAMAVFGGAAFRVYGLAGPAHAVSPDGLAQFDRWLWRLLAVGSALVLASAVAMVPCIGGVMAGSLAAAADPAILGATLFGTQFGHVWCWHLALALLLVVMTSRAGRAEPVLGLALLVLAGLAMVGHPADLSGWAGIGRQTNQAVHLIAAGLWLGGLVPLGWLLRRAANDPAEEFQLLVQEAVPAFSQMGYAAVALIAITGLINTAVLVGGVGALFGTAYGRVLTAKILLYLAMVGLALVNRLRLAPRLSQAMSPPAAAANLARSVIVEQALGLGILALIAVIGTLAPPASAP